MKASIEVDLMVRFLAVFGLFSADYGLFLDHFRSVFGLILVHFNRIWVRGPPPRTASKVKVRGFVLKPMDFALKMVDSTLKSCVFGATMQQKAHSTRRVRAASVSCGPTLPIQR